MPTAHLTVSAASDAHGVEIVVAGEVERAASLELARAVLAFEADNPATLVIDMAGVSVIDASGLRMLLDTARRATRDHRRFAVANPTEQVERLLCLTAIDLSLEIRVGARSQAPTQRSPHFDFADP